MDVQFLFGVPLASEKRGLFSSKEKTLTLQIMNYMANFIKSGYLSATIFILVKSCDVTKVATDLFFFTSE